MKGRLTVVIITKDEEENIRACLENVAWADEIIIVDSESDDRTREICREFTNLIFVKKMEGFGAQKQFGIEKATGDWILILDADERLSPELCDSLKRILDEGTPYDGFRIWRKTFYLGKWIRYCGWYAPVVRFFRRGKGACDMRYVHESIIVNGPIGEIRDPLMHFSYRSIDQHVMKISVYSAYDAKVLYERGIRIKRSNAIWYLAAKPSLIFIRKFIVMRGFLDGTRGFIISAFTAFIVFLNYSKVWEMQREYDGRSP